MLDLYIFIAFSAITILASLLLFIEKRLVHAVIALTTAFLGSALIFFLLGQTIVALLQLLVFVGGLSTYLVVAVATEVKGPSSISRVYFIVIAVVLAIGFSSSYLYTQGLPTQYSSNFATAATQAFESYYAIFYLLMVLLFSSAIGSVLIIKKFNKMIV